MNKLSESEDAKTLNLVRELFRRTVVGLDRNVSVLPRHLMVYTHTLITGAIAASMASKTTQQVGYGMEVWLSRKQLGAARNGVAAGGKKAPRPIGVSKMTTHMVLPEVKMTGADRWAPRRRIAAGNSLAIADYGLLLFQSALRGKKLNASEESHRALVDPLLRMLLKVHYILHATTHSLYERTSKRKQRKCVSTLPWE